MWENTLKTLNHKMENVVSGTCMSYVRKRYKCAEEGCEKGQKREGTIVGFLEPFILIESYKTNIQNFMKKRSPKNMEFEAKGVPKWSQNRCQN